MIDSVIYLIFGLSVVLPMVPAIVEGRRKSDALPLDIDQEFSRDPRYMSNSFRSRVYPLMANTERGSIRPFLARVGESARVTGDWCVAAGEICKSVILSSGSVTIGAKAAVTDVYAAAAVRLDAFARARTITADGEASIGANAIVTHWVDSNGPISVESGVTLGRSTSSGDVLRIGSDCVFRRLFGAPVTTGKTLHSRPSKPDVQEQPASHIAQPRAVFPGDLVVPPKDISYGDKIVRGSVRIFGDAVILGSIKCDGNIEVMENVQILGNLISRRNVIIRPGCFVSGHVFAERELQIESSVVGEPGRSRTVSAGGGIVLGPNCDIYGWVICDEGGRIVRDGPRDVCGDLGRPSVPAASPSSARAAVAMPGRLLRMFEPRKRVIERAKQRTLDRDGYANLE
jgi:predicted acyltransferase (DUF342 family)